MIYFIQIKEDGPIKIGRAKDPQKRLVSLQSGSPYPLRLLLMLEEEDEKKYHIQFNSNRTNREWFNPAKDLLDFIAKHPVAPWLPNLRKRIGPWPITKAIKKKIKSAPKFQKLIRANRDLLIKKGFNQYTVRSWAYGYRMPDILHAMKLSAVLGVRLEKIPYRHVVINRP